MPKGKKYANICTDLIMGCRSAPGIFNNSYYMVMMYYWQKLGKCFTIKVALPHLLLGVMVAALSLSDQTALSTKSTNPRTTNIIAIASVMVNLHESQSDVVIQSQYPIVNKIAVQFTPVLPTFCIESGKVIRLTPNNGIRAGPLPLIV